MIIGLDVRDTYAHDRDADFRLRQLDGKDFRTPAVDGSLDSCHKAYEHFPRG